MNLSSIILKRLLKRKLATIVLVSASLAAFAALGDGGKKDVRNTDLSPYSFCSKNFTLRSGYNYKSNKILDLNTKRDFIMLNTVATVQKGNATYVLPLKKKVFLGKVKFTLR